VTKEEQKQQYSMNGFKSKNHQVYTISTCKDALVNYDNKLYLVNNIDTLSYGNKKLNIII